MENRNFPVLAPYSLRVLNKLLSSACFHFLISKGMILYCPTRLLEWFRKVIYENRRASAVPSSHFDNNIITALTTDALGHDLKKFCYSQGIRARMSEWKTKSSTGLRMTDSAWSKPSVNDQRKKWTTVNENSKKEMRGGGFRWACEVSRSTWTAQGTEFTGSSSLRRLQGHVTLIHARHLHRI